MYFKGDVVKLVPKVYTETIQHTGKSLLIKPNYADEYVNRGVIKVFSQDYVNAIKDFDKAISINPTYAAAYNNRGIAKYFSQDYTGAIEDYNKAISIDPTNIVEYYNRGIAKNQLKNYAGAIEDYNTVISINPNFVEAYIARGIAKWMAGNQKIDAPITWVNELMAKSPRPSWMLLAPGVWLMIIFAVGMAVVLRYSVFGRHIFAIGSNEATARLCGVRINRTKILVYTIAGLFCGLSGVMEFSRLTVGDPTVAVGLELDIIAAVVIGGGSLSGGAGSILGSMIGVFIMAFLRNGCTMMGWPNYIQEIIIGSIIDVTVFMTVLSSLE